MQHLHRMWTELSSLEIPDWGLLIERRQISGQICALFVCEKKLCWQFVYFIVSSAEFPTNCHQKHNYAVRECPEMTQIFHSNPPCALFSSGSSGVSNGEDYILGWSGENVVVFSFLFFSFLFFSFLFFSFLSLKDPKVCTHPGWTWVNTLKRKILFLGLIAGCLRIYNTMMWNNTKNTQKVYIFGLNMTENRFRFKYVGPPGSFHKQITVLLTQILTRAPNVD